MSPDLLLLFSFFIGLFFFYYWTSSEEDFQLFCVFLHISVSSSCSGVLYMKCFQFFVFLHVPLFSIHVMYIYSVGVSNRCQV